MLNAVTVSRRKPNGGIHSTLDRATERGLRPQPASACSASDTGC